MNDFTNCPQLYKYRAIDQLPEPPSIDAERGKLIHAVLEDLFELPAQSRTFESAIELLPQKWSAQLERTPELAALVLDEKEWQQPLLSTQSLAMDFDHLAWELISLLPLQALRHSYLSAHSMDGLCSLTRRLRAVLHNDYRPLQKFVKTFTVSSG